MGGCRITEIEFRSSKLNINRTHQVPSTTCFFIGANRCLSVKTSAIITETGKHFGEKAEGTTSTFMSTSGFLKSCNNFGQAKNGVLKLRSK